MRLFLSYLATLLLVANFCNGQRLYFNCGVDTLEPDVQKAIHFYEQYLNEFKAGKNASHTLPDFKKYWSQKDCERYKIPDQLIYAFASDYPTYLLGDKRTILMIKPTKDYIQIKTQFSSVDSANNVTINSITNHYIKFNQNNQPYLVNPIDLNIMGWQTSTVRNIEFHYPAYHHFNKQKAAILIAKIQQLEKDWGLHPINIRYYFANTANEIQQLRGFEFVPNMGNRDKPTGISDEHDNLVYCNGNGEDYFHEIVHIYLNRLCHTPSLGEGLAQYYGGSMGHELSWHQNKLNEYLKQHPQIDLNQLDNLPYMDNYTNPNGVIKGLLCKAAYTKSGIEGLKRITGYTSLSEILEKEFNCPSGNWNTFLRTLIASSVAQ